MRTRDRDEDWIEELGRRRLEALIAELTPSTGAPDADDAAQPADPSGDRAAPGGGVAVSSLAPEPGIPHGRHARRALSPGQRVREWVADRLPESAREQGLQQGHVGVLALLLAVAVLLG